MAKGRNKKDYNFKKYRKNNEINKNSKDDSNEITKIFVNNYINFIGSLCVYFTILISIRMLTETVEFLSYEIILLCITHYYVFRYILYDNTQEEKKSIILNILGVISLYNIFIALNPLAFIELSSSYTITNIFYFYISFFIFTMGWNLYEKLIFLVKLIYGLLNKSNKSVKDLLISIIFFTMAVTYPLALISFMYDLIHIKKYIYLTCATIISLTIIFFFISLIIYYKTDQGNKNISALYKNIIKRIENNKKEINNKNNWFVEVFNIKKVSNIKFIDLKMTSNIFNDKKNMLMFLLRYLPIVIFISITIKDNYYMLYSENNKICINEELNNKNIIKLKNENVLIEKIKNNEVYLTEMFCKKKNIEFMYSPKRDD